ncbi:putative Rod shape-determining protein mreC [Chlamydiales bacterium STE3]|nr:putative Rod shape-determining protein mreC [Chlamydiales bacterium STE3]
MYRSSKKIYFLLAFLLCILLFMPASIAHQLRVLAISTFTPSFEKVVQTKAFVHSQAAGMTLKSQPRDQTAICEEEVQRLKLENRLLHEEIVRLKELLEQELSLLSQGFNEQYFPESHDDLKQAFFNHQKRILELFRLRLSSLPAKVIFRAANSWNSSLWINLGEADNKSSNEQIVAKNSPVVLGDSVVGLIDYVGKKQSRVRLITDCGLSPSVRVSRDDLLLAKGELSGQSLPLWRSKKQVLVGTGFNYDFPDEEGPARDLRTGEPTGTKGPSIPVIQVNDHLVTTGMDGVFPPGLKVGIVTHITPLKEGDYYYELEAKPIVKNLQDLSLVFVLPPLGYDRGVKIPTQFY